MVRLKLVELVKIAKTLGSLNSTMVRLKLFIGLNEFVKNIKMSQFHYGSIKTAQLLKIKKLQ